MPDSFMDAAGYQHSFSSNLIADELRKRNSEENTHILLTDYEKQVKKM
jgi:hypothetical protein